MLLERKRVIIKLLEKRESTDKLRPIRRTKLRNVRHRAVPNVVNLLQGEESGKKLDIPKIKILQTIKQVI